MNTKNTKYKTLEAFVNETRAQGRYAFSWEEASRFYDGSGKALSQALYRLKKKGRIVKVRKSFYAVIPPEYSKYGMLPPHLFIDDLMYYLGKPYYVSLFSAAALHGAAHQQPMEYYIMTKKPPLRNIKNDKLVINFFVKKDWREEDVEQKKTDAGYITVSSPEFTALDLLTYGGFGINRIYTVLEELAEKMEEKALTLAAKSYPRVASVQRLGYILDKETGDRNLAGALQKALQNKKLHQVLLLPGMENNGKSHPVWKVIKNTKIESDL